MKATRFLTLAPVNVQAAVGKMTTAERGILEDELRALLCSAAWKFGYLNQRGTFDPKHRTAVKRANGMLRTVRKSIGYTYPGAASINV